MLVWYLGGEDSLEEGMAPHSSILAWRIPRTEEPGRLQSMGSQRVRHNQSDLAHMHCILLEIKNWDQGKEEQLYLQKSMISLDVIHTWLS